MNIEEKKDDLLNRDISVEEVIEAIHSLTDSYKDQILNVKNLIKEYFSDDVEKNNPVIADLRRDQIKKELIDFANKI